MADEPVDIGLYLKRIGLDSAPSNTLSGLTALQKSQARTIAFENFDILLGRGIDVSRPAIFRKVLGQRRGGYCFEVNELYFAALEALGFKVRRILARVHLGGQPSALTHQSTLCQIDDTALLTDTGFGGFTPRGPVHLHTTAAQKIDHMAYRVIPSPLYGTMLQDLHEGTWRDLFSFEDRPVLSIDLVHGNYLTATHPLSFFTWGPRAAIQTERGVTTLLGQKLTRAENGSAVEGEVPGGDAYLQMLEDSFGLVLDAPYEAIRPLNPPPPRA